MAYKKLKYWFDEELGKMLADKIKVIQPRFDKKNFVREIKCGVEGLELKARVSLIADNLHQFLGGSYEENATVLEQILGPENTEETGMFSNFYWLMPVADYVEKYGQENFKRSMQLLMEITKRNTSEYAIRPFLEKYPRKTLAKLKQWSTHKNSHVRRLASEGPRPRLPWATKLQQFIEDPSPIFPILENLKDDPSKYVQKSVANCLNDILKDHPVMGKAVLERWNVDPSPQRKWIIKHALRNWIKKKDFWALQLIQQGK